MTSLTWMHDGLCSQIDPELFFPPTGGHGTAMSRRAVRACLKCPVRARCLDYALETGQEHGVWGGTTAHQRIPMIRQMRRAS